MRFSRNPSTHTNNLQVWSLKTSECVFDGTKTGSSSHHTWAASSSCLHSLSRAHPPRTSSAIITSACSSSHRRYARRRTQPRVHPARERRHLLLLHAEVVERHRVDPVTGRCREPDRARAALASTCSGAGRGLLFVRQSRRPRERERETERDREGESMHARELY